jgi:circadian clock protein KaiC
LIGKDGISIFPITSIKTEYKISMERVSTGIASMDKLLGGKGYYRGSSILITGTAGTGKSSFAAYFANAACGRGEKCLYIAFEETQDQIIRNMSSIGIDLEKWVKKGLLKFHITRPTSYGLEMHLLMMEDDIKKFQARNVIIDPITDFSAIGGGREVKSMTSRLNDMLKSNNITVLYTDLIRGDINPEAPEMHISSLIDTWVMLRNFEFNGERSRGITILKSRGMSHSNQISEFTITRKGIELVRPYIGPSGVFMGSTKIAQEAKDNAIMLDTQRAIDHARAMLDEKHKELDAKILALKAQYKADENELEKTLEQKEQDLEIMLKDREILSKVRSTK